MYGRVIVTVGGMGRIVPIPDGGMEDRRLDVNFLEPCEEPRKINLSNHCAQHSSFECQIETVDNDGLDTLGRLSESIEPVVIDGFDLTFERRVLSAVVRQVYFSW